jgi:raffinose/stachyose/melibiose transport system permease protein
MGIIRDKKAFLVFLIPGLLFYLFSVFYPITESIRLSFMDWNGIGPQKFVGFENYTRMFQDPVFYKAVINNLLFLLIVVTIQLSIGLLFAILLTYMTKKANLIKTFYYIPCIITTIAVSQLFRSLYSTQPEGLLNQLLSFIGLGHLATSWLTNLDTVLVAVSIPEGWRFIGMYMVIFYAALLSIDSSVYEAAKIDGANELKILFKIKIPMIKDILLLTSTMCLTGALRGFDIPYLLTNGGPGNASELLSTYMYKQAFTNNQYGYGSSLAVFIIIESIIIVVILRRIFGKSEGKKITKLKTQKRFLSESKERTLLTNER